VFRAVGDGGDQGRIAATFLAGNPGSQQFTSALFFRKRKQKHKDTQSGKDSGGDEACRCNLCPGLKTCFEMSGDADQKE